VTEPPDIPPVEEDLEFTTYAMRLDDPPHSHHAIEVAAHA
jgi:hypothetical protein